MEGSTDFVLVNDLIASIRKFGVDGDYAVSPAHWSTRGCMREKKPKPN